MLVPVDRFWDASYDTCMNWQAIGLVLLIGFSVAMLGTYLVLKSTQGPLERAFIIRACSICWLGGILSVAGLFFIPAPWKFGMLIIYLLKVATSILRWRRRALELREQDTAGKM